jgi:hypothetical protein
MPVAYCQFGFPVAAISSSAIIGGSGSTYPTIDAAIIGESEVVYTDTTLVGTTNGIVVGGAGFPVTDDELTGAYLVLTDLAPGNGKAALWARIIDYVGATKTATLDSPIDVGVGFEVKAIFPAVVTVNRDLVEDVSIIKSLILNFGGSELSGNIDITAGTFVWLNEGTITDGIRDVRSIASVLKMDDLTVSAKESTIYAVLKNEAINVAAIEATDCEFRGVVAGRQGICRWVIKDCLNLGIPDTDGNVAYRLLEADGIARTFSNVSVTINGQFYGAVAFAKGAGSIVSAAPLYLSIFADIQCPVGGDPDGMTQSPRAFSVLMVRGAATATIAPTTGQVAISTGSINDTSASDDPDYALDFSLLRGRTFSGSGTLTLGMPDPVLIDLSRFGGMSSLVTVDGTGTSSGTLTLNGTSVRNVNIGDGHFAVSLLRKGLVGTGAITVSTGDIHTKGGKYFSGVYFLANQTVGTPAVTISAQLEIDNCLRIDQFGFDTAVTSITVGTWTISSTGFASAITQLNPVGTLGISAGITGGTWSVSGDWSVNFASGAGSTVGVAAAFAGGTATLSVAGTWRLKGGTHLNVRVNHARDNGAGVSCTVTRAGITYLTDMTFRGAFAFLFAEVATSVVAGAGDVEASNCIFNTTGMNLTNSAVVGSTLTVPSIANLRYCQFAATFALRFGLGTFAGACNVFMNYTEIVGVFTINGTNFPVLIGEMCQFLGDPAALAFVTVDPATTFRFNKCSFPNGRYYAINGSLTLGKPTIVDDQIVSDAGAATTAEFISEYDGTGRLIDLAAAAGNAAGIILEAAGAAGTRQRAIVHGFGFLVADNAGIAAQGDPLDPGAVTAGRVETATVKRIGYAIDAVAFPVAAGDRAYCRIHVDR